ncbi:MAG: HEPN domain-containing protein [Isosphaeraceae bacterium]
MGRSRLPPDDPREWLNRARSNPACAKAEIPEAYLEDLCYHAQQAAEKSIKAVFLHRGLTFPYIHDLAKLLTLLENSGLKVPKYVRRAEPLTRFAVETRYPGFSGPVTPALYRRTVRLAEAVLHRAERQRQLGKP